MTETVLRDQFRAMGCKVVIDVVGGRLGHLSWARDRIAHLESCWSRFRPHSDLSRLNAAQGAAVVVDPSTITLLEAMAFGFTATDGAFDPTLLAPLVRLGYAASWRDPSAVTTLPVGVQSRGSIRGVSIDANGSMVSLPPGTAVDAGGIGRGLAADMVVEMLLGDGVDGAMVAVGGDVCVAGDGPVDGDWLVPIADAFQTGRVGAQVILSEGGIATSAIRDRSWRAPDGGTAHHVLDPIIGRPTPIGLELPVQATVVAGSAMWAEVHAKLLMVRGPVAALPRLDGIGLGGRVVHGSGHTMTNAAWATFDSTELD